MLVQGGDLPYKSVEAIDMHFRKHARCIAEPRQLLISLNILMYLLYTKSPQTNTTEYNRSRVFGDWQ